jgi:surface polysaccharide O-acyltransferase-like enzyme
LLEGDILILYLINTLLKRDLVCVVDARKDNILILYLTGTLLKRDLVCVVDAREGEILNIVPNQKNWYVNC